jgi:glycosyltransferase involved in cell wall biosynthesis
MGTLSRRRVLFVDETSPIAGGVNSLLLLLRNLNQEKYEPILVAPEGRFLQAVRELDIETIEYDFKHLRLTFGLLGRRAINPLPLVTRLRDAIFLCRVTRGYGVSLIHANTLNTHISSRIAGQMLQVPVVWHVRRINTFSILYRDLFLPDRVIFVSQAAMRQALGHSAAQPRASVIHNGIDLASFRRVAGAYDEVRQEFGLGLDSRIVGSVGRLDVGKGYEYFVEAARLVLESGLIAKFMIVGENQYGDSYVNRIHRLVADLDLENQIIFAGFRTDVARLMSAFDVFVCPSVKDAHPRVVLEAMALKLPIVGTLSGGIAETIEDGSSGLLVPTENSSSLARAIIRFLSDSELASRIGRAAYNRVARDFSARTYVEQVERVYSELLEVSE